MRKVKKGDIIRDRKGNQFEVEEVLYAYQGAYTHETDIEFLDPNGGYHHWKSYFDGGEIIYAD